MSSTARHRGCLLGLACGDAVGTTVEFSARNTFPPVTDMIGGGPFGLPAGAWTDDTSMALCLANSLLECGRFDATDQMRRYCQWHDNGYMSSTGECFDIGLTVRHALNRFRDSGDPYSGSTNPMSAGNGCIMRLAPIPLAYDDDFAATRHFAAESSRTTHAALECIEASQLLAEMIYVGLKGASKNEMLLGLDGNQFQSSKVRDLAFGTYRLKSIDEIRGSGYVIDSLEAAAWCFLQTESFRDAVLLAVNLGDDADTTGAVCGQIAGAFYSEEGIPTAWIKRLVWSDKIRDLADALASTRFNAERS